jgi:hypothetical protein
MIYSAKIFANFPFLYFIREPLSWKSKPPN